jgi:hypothetical protein
VASRAGNSVREKPNFANVTLKPPPFVIKATKHVIATTAVIPTIA